MPTDNTEPNIASNLKFSVPSNSLGASQNNNPVTIKIDHRFAPGDSFYAKTNWNTQPYWYLGSSASSGVPTTNGAANLTYQMFQGWGGALSETHVFSSTFFVETLLNKVWQTVKIFTGPPDAQQNWSAVLGLPNPYGQIGWPNITSVGANFATYIEGDNRRYLSSGITTGQQNYSWIKNNHTIQFGRTFHDEMNRYLPDEGSISGSAAFSSLATALESSTSGSTSSPVAVGNTGFDAANFFLGGAATYSVYLSHGAMKVDQKTYALYAQDNWRVNGRLTLTPG